MTAQDNQEQVRTHSATYKAHADFVPVAVAAGTQVETYLNKRQGNKFTARGGKPRQVLFHADFIMITGATFKVAESGRQRTIAGNCEIHATISGAYQPVSEQEQARLQAQLTDSNRIRYNPFTCGNYFVNNDPCQAVTAADKVVMANGKIYFIS